MKKLFLLAWVVVAMLFLLPTLHATQAPADMTITVPSGATATKAPVDFSHAKHAALDCGLCHHTSGDSGQYNACSSSGCHEDLKTKKGGTSFYAAFHASKAANSCLGCHKDRQKKNQAGGPTSCNSCHPKEKPVAVDGSMNEELKEGPAGAEPPTSMANENSVHVLEANDPSRRAGNGPPPPPGKGLKPKVSGSWAFDFVWADNMNFIDAQQPPQPAQNTERYAEIEQNSVKRAAENPVSTFSIDVDTGAYSNMRRFLNQGQLPPKDAVRVEELINYFSYDYQPPKDRSTPFNVITEIAPTPWNQDTLLLSIGIKGYEIEAEERPAANLVFLLDVSGSMDSPDKLPLLVSAYKLLTKELTERDRVSIVVYAGAAGIVLKPTPGNETAKITAALEHLRAGGSTAGGEGIQLAYAAAREAFIEGGINRILLATDGDFNVGIVNFQQLLEMVEQEREDGISLTTLGFGQGNYNEHLMEQLADKGNGNHAYIDTLQEANKVLVTEMSSTLFTIAKDVKIQVEFNPAVVAEYRLIGYENRILAREDFENDAVDAGDIGAGHTVTALYEVALVGSKGLQVPPLRYGEKEEAPVASELANELCFLKLRYKLPDEDESTLMEYPLTKDQVLKEAAAASDNFRFAASVAAFGGLLREARYIGEFAYDDVLELARSGRGEDPDGHRGEFLSLASLAKTLAQ